MKKNLFVWAAGLIALSACSNNDELPNNIEGKVTVTATLPSDVADSRVALTEDNTNAEAPTIKVAWETEESFSVIRGLENVTYSKHKEGNTFMGDEHTTTEGNYYAFYPTTSATATTAMPYDFSTQKGALDAAKTYMYAKNETDGKNYEFSHLTALVKFTLTLPDDATDVTPVKVVISSDKLQPVGTVDLTDTEVTYTASEDAKTSITITPEAGQASLSFYAYVNPMSLSDSETNTFIISMDGSDGNYYSGTLETSASIQTGYLYAASVSMIKVEKGDFAMKNGSFIKYDANATLTDEQKANVVGIVFWTETEDNGPSTLVGDAVADKIMKADFPNCTHGLIVSLKNVSTGYSWQIPYESVYDNFQNTEAFNPTNKSDYAAIESGKTTGQNIDKILGYNNTKVLEAYNTYCKENGKDSYVVKLIETLATWKISNSAPKNTTGWFLPSVKELHMLCYKDVYDVSSKSDFNYNDTRIVVDTSIEKADGYKLYEEDYWSSSENADKTYDSYAFLVRFPIAYVSSGTKSTSNYVRAICAY